jgi:hypothetical protein
VITRPNYRDVGISMIMESLGHGGASVIISTSVITESARVTSVPLASEVIRVVAVAPTGTLASCQRSWSCPDRGNPHADSRLARNSAAPRRDAVRAGNNNEVPALLSQRQLRDYVAAPGRRSAATGHRLRYERGPGCLGSKATASNPHAGFRDHWVTVSTRPRTREPRKRACGIRGATYRDQGRRRDHGELYAGSGRSSAVNFVAAVDAKPRRR